jgi:hypothetical protein
MPLLAATLFASACGSSSSSISRQAVDDDNDDDNDDDASPADDDNDASPDDDNDASPDDDNDASPDDDASPAADDDATPHLHMLPGPNEPGYDADLEAKAMLFDRSFQNFNAYALLINSDVVIPLDHPDDRQLVADFLHNSDSWDFKSWSGKDPEDIVTDNQATAGLYAGSGIAGEAYRYGVMRDQGYPQADVDRARQYLLRGMEGLRIAVEITGVKGVMARGYVRTDVPGEGATTVTTPLFDAEGNPLPPVKTNGTARADNSPDHKYPNYIWIDGLSRDQLLGWASAFGAVWEVIQDDPTFDPRLKALHRQYASDVAHKLMTVRPDGFDLEIIDADTRTTVNGLLNENAWDTIYLPWLPIKDGSYALMSSGIIAALAYASGDPEVHDYLYTTLLGARKFADIIYQNVFGADLGWDTNYSSTNMAFAGYYLAQRYIDDPVARDKMRHSLLHILYANPDDDRLPKSYSYSFFDFAYAGGVADASVYNPHSGEFDEGAVARGVQTLKEFPDPPYWEITITNCTDQEIADHWCQLNDGTWVVVLGYVGRSKELLCEQPIPQRVRPPSNYQWRSSPFDPNGGGDGSRLLGAVDWRWAYWLGRYAN